MKVFFDGIIYSWQTGGGVYRYFEEIINRSYQESNIEAILLLPFPCYKVSDKKGVIIKNILFFKGSFKLFYKFFRKVFSPINKILFHFYFRNRKDGVFHSTYYTTYDSLEVPQVLTVHDMTHEKFPEFFHSSGAVRFINNKKKCIESADAIIAVSEATKKSLIEIYNVDEKKITVIYHGLSDVFTKDVVIYKKYSDKPFFLFTGNRNLYKNFIFFANAFSKWGKNKNYNIVLTGGGNLSAEEVGFLKESGIYEQIIYLGFIKEEELKYLYQNAEAFVFPSLDEGFGFPVIEAISSKTKVLVSNIDVFKEIGEDMVVYFDPRDINSLISGFTEIISNQFTKEEMERRSKYVINKFTWDKCMKETVGIYTKLINEKNN